MIHDPWLESCLGSLAGRAAHLDEEEMRTVLREALVEGRRAGLGTEEGVGSLRCRVSGALYALLLLHPVDQHGRCQSCRRPGALFSWRRRPCAVHQEASFWLRKHAWFLASREVPGVPFVPLVPNNHRAHQDTQDGDAPQHPGRHRRSTLPTTPTVSDPTERTDADTVS